ncbi:hypothetical protein BDV96DRAFT_653450 [Lophiotrema nucula]|uniref:Uncharacterized protein n=1 Tax=Lophiotrema nucula TaxID=690887 RepID=A0A6A5YKF7_9PLEO|nr:hypothetical protein BDV96DRAFT_653450 [Lophiotrema nucula]
MSAHEVNVNLPRASLISYFRRPQRTPSLSTPINHANGMINHQSRNVKMSPENRPLLPRIVEEEEEIGFWGEHTEDRDQGWRRTLSDVLGVLLYVALIFVVVLNLDMFLNRWNVGVLSWSNEAAIQGEGLIDIHLCHVGNVHDQLGSSQRTWNVTPSDALGNCDTEAIVLHMTEQDVAYLSFGDWILIGGGKQVEIGKEENGKFLAEQSSGNPDDVDVGDDPAEEVKLGNVEGNSMHAGFGGPWGRK